MTLKGTTFSTVLDGGNPTATRTVTFPDKNFVVAPTDSPVFTGTVVVPNALADNQAVTRGRVLNVAPHAQAVGQGSLAASTTYNNSITITAPCAGYIFGSASVVLSNQAAASIAFAIQINGTNSQGDNTLLPMTEYGTIQVAAGAVTTLNAQIVTGSTAPSAYSSTHILGVFIPSPSL